MAGLGTKYEGMAGCTFDMNNDEAIEFFRNERHQNGYYLDTKNINWKYDEGEILEELKEYLAATYKQHYVGKNEIQAVDVWKTKGTLESTSADNAIKYLMRYGKKDGHNRKDLLKAIHYVFFMIHEHNNNHTGDLNEDLNSIETENW